MRVRVPLSRPWLLVTATLLLVASLAGCGGGGGDKVTIGVKFDQPGLSVKNPDGSLSGFDVDVATSERVGATPPPGNIEQLEVTDGHRHCPLLDQVVPHRLEAEQGPQEQQRDARRPGLRATGRRVFDRIPCQLAVVAPERRGQPPVEVGGRVEHPGGDTGGGACETP